MTAESQHEYKKVFMDIDTVFNLDSQLFGKKWNEVRMKQLVFLMKRPLMLKVLTQKFFGPQLIINRWTDEWWEAEVEYRNSDRAKQIEELADMTLLLLTQDSLNPKLSFPNQIALTKMMWDGTVGSYCNELGIDKDDLVPFVVEKITVNSKRNPKEAFKLIEDENIYDSGRRKDDNWLTLKRKRNNPGKAFTKTDNWWKQRLYVDDRGVVKER